MSVNEKKFIQTALLSDLRIDGRGPFDFRTLTIKFGREDGSSEVQLGQTHMMGFVTSQLVEPYRDRPNEGSLSIYTEFSPMADPSFEAGRPGEFAVELDRIIDRGLSLLAQGLNLKIENLTGTNHWVFSFSGKRAVDTESLCVLAGKLVWSIRIDLHILDNGGNLVDASNVAALTALLTFRRPEVTLGGDDNQEVIVHPPEVREPLPLILHHLPIAVTFAFFGDDNAVVIDPTHYEEAVMGGRMTATLNTNGDVCAIQKAGGDGVIQSVIMQCLQIASVKAADITTEIRKALTSSGVKGMLGAGSSLVPHASLKLYLMSCFDLSCGKRGWITNEVIGSCAVVGSKEILGWCSRLLLEMCSDSRGCFQQVIAGRRPVTFTPAAPSKVETYNTERALRKIKRHTSSVAVDIDGPGNLRKDISPSSEQKAIGGISSPLLERLKLVSEENNVDKRKHMEGNNFSEKEIYQNDGIGNSKNFIGGPSSRASCNETILKSDQETDALFFPLLVVSQLARCCHAIWTIRFWISISHGKLLPNKKSEELRGDERTSEANSEEPAEEPKAVASETEALETNMQSNGSKTLLDAVKPKNQRKKKAAHANDAR
ncbi:Exoribonuclease, phosphorolytic domain 2 [Dillenia turbinata]|uniref:Protein ECERIFERUM 7 n=1 Tax=Dillenia turbinata TaxID=194707 RepID=A0AAN8YW34_9MAGN